MSRQLPHIPQYNSVIFRLIQSFAARNLRFSTLAIPSESVSDSSLEAPTGPSAKKPGNRFAIGRFITWSSVCREAVLPPLQPAHPVELLHLPCACPFARKAGSAPPLPAHPPPLRPFPTRLPRRQPLRYRLGAARRDRGRALEDQRKRSRPEPRDLPPDSLPVECEGSLLYLGRYPQGCRTESAKTTSAPTSNGRPLPGILPQVGTSQVCPGGQGYPVSRMV